MTQYAKSLAIFARDFLLFSNIILKRPNFPNMQSSYSGFAAIAIVLIPASASAAKTKETCTIKGNLKNALDTLLTFTNPQSIQRDPVLTHKGSVNFCINV